MAAYIFLCSNETEGECLKKNLFGGGAGYASAVKKLRIGDPVFLYNLESGVLHGEFVATSEAAMRIDERNPKKRVSWGRYFPVQVCVRRRRTYVPLQRKELELLLGFKFRRGIYPPSRLDESLLILLRERFSSTDRVHPEEIEFRLKNEAKIYTKDGHRVRSESERLIDDWLYEHHVVHTYETKIGSSFCDFFVPFLMSDGAVIEFWGKEDKPYLARKQWKLHCYEKNNVELLQLRPTDLRNLDTHLSDLAVHQRRLLSQK